MAKALARVVTRFPKVTLAFFVIVAILAASFIPGLKLYLSFYQLIPSSYIEGDELTTDYYTWYTELNSKYGGDNWDYYAVRADNVTDVKVVREINAVSEIVAAKYGCGKTGIPDEMPCVQGFLSVAELVKIANHLATGRYEFPPDSPEGDQQIRTSLDLLLSIPQYRDQIIGNLVSKDYRTAILLIILEQGRPLEDYRVAAANLKDLGFDADKKNDYAAASTMYPINVDTIYLKLDAVTLDEGLWWVALAASAVVVVSLFLFRSPVFTAITLLNLTVVVSVTLATLYFMGGYLNLLTMLLVALIFGVGDDYTTYALTIYRNERAKGHSLRKAVDTAAADLASALLIAALVTLSGFAVIWLNGFPAIMIFGAMAGAGVFFAYVGCLTLVPACLWMYFSAVDKRKAAGKSTPGHDRLLRHGENVSSDGAKLSEFGLRHRKWITVLFVGLFLVALSPIVWGDGVQTWGGSYSEIFDQNTYEMRTYNNVSKWMGIPIDAVIFVKGDATDPAFLRMIDRLDKATGTSIDDPNRVHQWVRGDSLADVVRDNYPRYAASTATYGLNPADLAGTSPNPVNPQDQDGDGLPDDPAFLRNMYDKMWDDPATKVLMGRIVSRDYETTLVRVSINVETGDGRSPVENARMATADLEKVIKAVQAQNSAVVQMDDFQMTGLAVVVQAVIASIDFGNTWTTIIMVVVIFGLVTLYYRRPVHTLLIMTPILFGVTVQYFLMSYTKVEMTYVAVIITSVDMGLGIDLGVHMYAGFREKLREGLEPKKAILESTGAVNVAMIAALFTDMSAFLLIPWSDITWAAQTARILLASVGAILLVAIFVLPSLFYWDAKRNPRAYGAPAPTKTVVPDARHMRVEDVVRR